jgi:DNA polymerase-3 subunit gamma/tau
MTSQHMSLPLKYRPQKFSDLSGQDVNAQILRNMLMKGAMHPSLIFSGTRGLGKTTTARIVARALNCTQPVDQEPCGTCTNCQDITAELSWAVKELDAASNGSVDDIRQIKNDLNYAPLAATNYVVYVIDEAHSLSNAAWQAFLKLLEEPPPRVVFVFCSTEVHRIPETIVSRSMHFSFPRLHVESIVKRLRYIAGQEQIEVTDEALQAIARSANGGMRDAISLLEQLTVYAQGAIQTTHVQEVLGIVPREVLFELVAALFARMAPPVYALLARIYQQISDVSTFLRDFQLFLRELLLVKLEVPTPDLQADHRLQCQRAVQSLPFEYLQQLQFQVQQILTTINRSSLPARSILDAYVVNLFYGGYQAPTAVATPTVPSILPARYLTAPELAKVLNATLLS